MPMGVWFFGARGSVATTTVVGALAIRAGLTDQSGCVTALEPLSRADLPPVAELVFGGHDIVTTPLPKRAEVLAASAVVPAALVAALHRELRAVDEEIRPVPHAGTQEEVAAALVEDIVSFQRRHGLDRVVAVDVASTEPLPPAHPAHGELAALHAALARPGDVLPPSSLYAYAAMRAGCSYVDFTPSTGMRLPALAQLADRQGLPYAGHDGKTGETLLKSVLAPMFAVRNLRVHSWSGTNLLGGGDGARLAQPEANAAKVASKGRVLAQTLGYQPEGDTRIEYVPSLGDFKTAWDLVTFSGFLGTQMRMEFTWHGCDSALAAPLVLDLARLTAAAHRGGRRGPLTELAFFFKDPLGSTESGGAVGHSLFDQWAALCRFAAELG
jgi:myo-inositol-1-phosphate synthase